MLNQPDIETNIMQGMSQHRIDLAKVNRISQLSKRSAYGKNLMILRNSNASIIKSGVGQSSTVGSVNHVEDTYQISAMRPMTAPAIKNKLLKNKQSMQQLST